MKTVVKSYLLRVVVTLLTAVPLLFSSCIDEDEFPNTPQGNFEALWQIIDQHYCFLDYKQHEIGLDWQQVYQKYKVRVNASMTNQQLFEVLAAMLSELRDGHVNLTAAHDYARSWSWFEDYPSNFSDSLQRVYLGHDYKIAAGIDYRVLDDNIGYIRYESFQQGVGDGNLNEVLSEFMTCNGLIIDIRNNGGGDLTTAERLAARFVHQTTLVGYMQHKTGTGHSDFSELEAKHLEPSSRVRWHKPVCVLTNRSVFSAANDFAMMMHALPGVTLVGDRTGGGSGMPMNNSLPNGWTVRYSACPIYDKDRRHVEFGIDPDVPAALDDKSTAQNIDLIIEKARKILSEK